MSDPVPPRRSSGPDGDAARQSWDPDRYARTARFVSDLGAPLLEILAPQPDDRILDLGCGDGALTERIAAAGATVVGVDASAEQVAACRARGIEAHVVAGEALLDRTELHGRFDGVLSNAALHWMSDDPSRVIAGVAAALRPGGRFVGEMGGAGNVAAIAEALEAALDARGLDGGAANPWYFPTPEAYRARLEASGFAVVRMEHFARPTPLPGPLEDWLDNFGEPFLKRLPPAERAPLKREVADRLRDRLIDAEGRWVADYVRLRFAAELSEATGQSAG